MRTRPTTGSRLVPLLRKPPKPKVAGPLNRVVFVEGFFLFFAICVVLRLLYVEVWQSGKYRDLAKAQHYTAIPLEAQRGIIYDRNQNLLALNDACISVGVDLRQVKDRRSLANKLAPLLHEPASALLARMRTDLPFVWLKRRVDAELAQKIQASKIPGLRLEKDARRRYPHKEIGAHLIGFTDVDGRGISGIELACDSLLRGQDGRRVLQRDAIGNALPDLAMPEVQPVHGQHVYLTIDYILQTIATEELRASLDFFAASSGTVTITDPRTGEVLALACEPGFDLNNPGAYSPATRRNRAVTDQVEPGSTFKLVTLATILQEKIRQTHDVIFCENGAYKFAGKVITDHGERYGNLSVAQVLANSSNIGTTKLARLAGKEKIYRYARDFGFGMPARTGLEGEAGGTLKPPSDWSGYTIAAMAMGYEVSVTAMQMAMAYGAVANGGLLLRPRVIAGIADSKGKVTRDEQPEVVRRVLSREVAATLTHLLEGVIQHGTGKNAKIDGVRIAGKTGTARRTLENARGYSSGNFLSSFVGFFPAEQPRYLIVVMIENPRRDHWGAMVAAPTFRRIAERMLGVEAGAVTSAHRSHEQTENFSEMIMDPRKIVVPDLTSRHRSVVEEILENLELKPIWDGEGDFILNQLPPPGAVVFRNSPVTLQLFQTEQSRRQPQTMPALVGLSLRQALRLLSVANVEARVVGSGRVVQQYPPAGTPITSGVRCELRCRSEVPVAREAVVH
ncbi:MAG: hypothetical protein DKINENOH_04502 [bacterium]|nr:hypothetical protein [bacterium]